MKAKKPPLHVLLDARKLGDGGIGVYIENLIHGFLALGQKQRGRYSLSLLVSPRNDLRRKDDQQAYVDGLLDKWKTEVTIIPERSKKYSPEEYLLLAFRQRGQLNQTQVFHTPHYTLPYFLKVPAVVTIHDIIHVTHPDSMMHRLVGKQLIASAMKRAAHVITVSEASKERLAEHFNPVWTPITVIPNGLQQGIFQRSDEEVKAFLDHNLTTKPYFVFVGSDRPHKGFLTLVHAWAKLRAYCAEKNCELPVLHAIGRRYTHATRAEVFAAGVGDSIRFNDSKFLSSDEMALLYSGAEAVVISSIEEGFGMMAIEAMACGARVVSTPVPSVQEVCGKLPYYAEAFDAEALFQAIVGLLEDNEKKEKRISDGIKRALRYTRERVARSTLKVYDQVAYKHRSEFSTKDD